MVDEITPKSKRYELYKRDASLRGRARTLSQILKFLAEKPENAEFADILRSSIHAVQRRGSDSDEKRRDRVVQALKEYASELGEIAEDAKLSKTATKKILAELIEKREVVVKSRDHVLAYGDHSTELYFLADYFSAV